MGYNADMGDGIFQVLTPEQVERLASLIKLVMDAGHGSVTIRSKNGKIRFISISLESEFELSGNVGALDKLNK